MWPAPAEALVQFGILSIIGAAIAIFLGAGAAIFVIMASLSAFHALTQSGSSGRKKQTAAGLTGAAIAALAAETPETGIAAVASNAATTRIFFIAFPLTSPR